MYSIPMQLYRVFNEEEMGNLQSDIFFIVSYARPVSRCFGFQMESKNVVVGAVLLFVRNNTFSAAVSIENSPGRSRFPL